MQIPLQSGDAGFSSNRFQRKKTLSAIPLKITLRQASCLIAVEFDDGASFELPFEYLRAFSPSAEVRGHGHGQAILQTGKENVRVTAIEPIGLYAVQLVFDDGHDSGLYTWKHLYDLGANQAENWKDYLDRLKAAGHARDDSADDDE